ncbi:hypothetical protein DS66_00040 [Mesotoga sp. SC_3PWM13N19]|nr:hypothetical protein DS66_00040 [Mesotoga sp. SC_3PWM13N19]
MPLQMNLAALILSWRSPVIAWSTVLFVTGDKDFFEERVRALIRVATTRETLNLIQERKI